MNDHRIATIFLIRSVPQNLLRKFQWISCERRRFFHKFDSEKPVKFDFFHELSEALYCAWDSNTNLPIIVIFPLVLLGEDAMSIKKKHAYIEP